MIDHRNDYRVTAWLKEELAGCETVLDLGCGKSSLLQYVTGIKHSTGVECFQPYIEESRNKGIHTEYIQSDIMKVNFPDGCFDAVMIVDVLEHLTKPQGQELMARMNRWAQKKVIVCVPNGWLPQGDVYGDGNEKQHHMSAWTVSELKRAGYSVKGYGGWHPLRGDGGNIIPTRTKGGHYLLAGLSALSEPVVRIFPSHAFQLFAVRVSK